MKRLRGEMTDNFSFTKPVEKLSENLLFIRPCR